MVEPLIKKKDEPTKGAERDEFLNRKSHPARLTMEETAWALGFSTHEIPVLIAGKLLKPLGNPAPNTMKWFAADTVKELRHDLKWLSRATDAVMLYWRGKNARKTPSGETVSAQPQQQTAASAQR